VLKKAFILVIAVFYLTVTSGVVVNLHYCMNRIASISFGHERDHEDGSCSKCGMNKTSNHCCKDDVQFVKVNDAHTAVVPVDDLIHTAETLPVAEIDLQDAAQGATVEHNDSYFSPPPGAFNKIYRTIRVFRI